MNVQEVMTRTPRSCRAGDSLVAAARVLWDHDCGAVPVIDEAGKPIGLLTDRDCCMAAYTRGLRLDEIPVAMAMAKVLFTVRADEPVGNALATMQKQRVRRLPVVDQAGKLCGIVSLADLATRGRSAVGGQIVDALAAIVAPRQAAAPASRPEPTALVVPKAPSPPAPTAPTAAPAAAHSSAGIGGKAKKNGKQK